jgi:hypothetical protein
LQWARLRALERRLKQQGASFHLLAGANLCPALVSQYMGVKQRQLL